MGLQVAHELGAITTAWSMLAFTFAYDLNSNLSAVTTWSPAGLATGKTCLVHDALNRLVAVGPALALESPGNVACKTEAELASVTVRFKYDARNRRVGRQDGTGPWKQWALLPDGSPLTEFWKPATSTGDWEKIREYVWLEGKPLAQVEYPGPTAAEGYVYSVHTDHLGLPRALTNSTGAVVWTAAPSRPYGDVVEATTTDPANGRTVATNLRLPGQYDERLLADIGVQGPYYNWNRWYLPSMGRYMELDPIALWGSFNTPFGVDWYGYARQRPLVLIDRTGLDETDWSNWGGGTRTPPILFGPTNGNWGGMCWGGGRASCDGRGNGPGLPLDSGDDAYMGHDLCYGECSGIDIPRLRNSCVSMCDRSLIDDLNTLDKDPRKWPRPPRPGTEADSRSYCDLAKQNFLCSGYPDKCKRK